MNRRVRLRLPEEFLAALLCLVCCASMGCGKMSMVEKVEQTPYLALSGSESLVLNVNLSRMRPLSIFTRTRDALLGKRDQSAEWNEMVAETGLNPIADIDRISIGLREPFDLEDPLANALLIFTGRFSNSRKFVDGFLRYAGERYLRDPPPFTRSSLYDIPTYSTQAASLRDPAETIELNFAFPSPSLMIFTRSHQRLVDCLGVISGEFEGIQASEDWQDRLERIEMASILWAAGQFPGSINASVLDRVKTEPELKDLFNLGNTRAIYAGIEIGNEYFFHADLECSGFESAEGLAKDLETARAFIPKLLAGIFSEGSPRIAPLESLLERLVITSHLETTSVILRVTKRDFDEFARDVTSPRAKSPALSRSPGNSG